LEGNYDNTRSVLANSCTGVTRTEAWTVTFDAARQGWVVEGALSGVQAGLAYDDRRYVSDNGAISFLVRAGIQTPRSGWQFRFQTLDGVMVATGDQDGDEVVDLASAEVSFRLPGDPLAVSWRVPGEDQGWSTVIDRVYAIVPLEGTDAVARVRPEDAQVDALWQ
jgi:hypothetical protein